MQQETMGWMVITEWPNQAWDLVVSSQYLLVYSALQWVFPSLDKEESPARRGAEGSILPCIATHPVPQGCSRSFFPHVKIKMGNDRAGAKAGEGEYLFAGLQCSRAGCHLWVSPPRSSREGLSQIWSLKKKCQFDFYCILICNECFTDILDKPVMVWQFDLMKLKYLSNLKTLYSNIS